MLNTGLITFHFAHHYGAQLQAYATLQAIQGLGTECEIIDFRLPHTTRTNELFKNRPRCGRWRRTPIPPSTTGLSRPGMTGSIPSWRRR